MIKRNILATAIFSSLLFSQAYADTVSINVRGTIAPASCQATINGGNLDWGNIPFSNLNPSKATTLPVKATSLNIDCGNAKSRFAFVAKDPGDGVVALGGNAGAKIIGHDSSLSTFSLGRDPNTGKPIGNFTLAIDKVTADNQLKRFGVADARVVNGKMIAYAQFVPINNKVINKIFSYSAIDNNGNSAQASKFKVDFLVEPQITKTADLTTAQKIDWGGTANIVLSYF